MNDPVLKGEQCGKVRSLSGFQKWHHVPEGHFDAADSFVKRIGHDEVKTLADRIFTEVRTAFGLKRREIEYQCDSGEASIKIPAFDVDIAMRQDADRSEQYVLTTSVGPIRQAAIVTDEVFCRMFTAHCNTVVVPFSRSVRLEDRIDDVEDLPELAPYLHYEPDCSSFTLDLPRPEIRIQVTADTMTFSLSGGGDLKTLITHTQTALSFIQDLDPSQPRLMGNS